MSDPATFSGSTLQPSYCLRCGKHLPWTPAPATLCDQCFARKEPVAWKATAALRWFSRAGSRWTPILQQQWACSDGTFERRDVPIEGER